MPSLTPLLPHPLRAMSSDPIFRFGLADPDRGAGRRATSGCDPRVLVIDDSASIHDDFRKILAPTSATGDSGLHLLEAELFGPDSGPTRDAPVFQVDVASQGAEGVELVARALSEGRPYAIAFVDLRMPPGWSGIETIHRIWNIDPRVQIVMCTAYADGIWPEMASRLGGADRVVLMEKPFAAIDVRRVAGELARKWQKALRSPSSAAPKANQ